MAVTTPARALLLAATAIAATIFLCFNRAAALQASAAGAPPATDAAADFVRRSCSSTMYSSLCYATLAPYADAVARDPIRLAGVATNVSLSRVRSVASNVSSIVRGPSGRQLDKRTVAALQDCGETLRTTARLTGQAIAAQVMLRSAKGTLVKLRVTNILTWLGAALTQENNCVDGFAGAGSSAVKADVTGQVREAGKHTSNALALTTLLMLH